MKYFKFIGSNAIINFITYTIMGLLAANLLGYEEIWKETLTNFGYRDFNSKWVMIGPLLQPIRGAIYGAILWPFRETILKSKYGWLKLFGLFWGIGIFGTFAAPIGSFEGIIYTTHSLKMHLWGQPEITGHALLYSYLLIKWCRDEPSKIKTLIKALCITILAKTAYIISSIMILAISGGQQSGEVEPIIYLGLILSALTLLLITFTVLNRKIEINKKKIFLVCLAGIGIPYFIIQLILGFSIIGFLSLLISGSLAGLITMALIIKLK